MESTDTRGEEVETAKVTVSDLPGTPHSLLAVFANLFFFKERKFCSALFWLHSVILVYVQKQIRKTPTRD